MNKKFITLFSIALIISINVLPAAMTADDLFTAVAQGKVERAQEIIRQKGGHVFIHALDAHGRTPLHIAACNGYAACIDLLITNGARVDDPGTVNGTPLHFAADKGHTTCVERLVYFGADINAITLARINGTVQLVTPLILAALKNHADCVLRLLRAGADPMYVPTYDNFGTPYPPLPTAEELARSKGFTIVAKILSNAREKHEEEAKALQASTGLLCGLFS